MIELQVFKPIFTYQDALIALRIFQAARVEKTYQDFFSDPRHRPPCSFFLTDIYGVEDFSARYDELEKMYRTIRIMLPQKMAASIGLMIDLNNKMQRLDALLAEVLFDNYSLDDGLNANNYACACRDCNNYVERVEQVNMIFEIIVLVEEVVKQPMASTSLLLAGKAAQVAGWGDTHRFFARGYAAFKHIGDASDFIKAIKLRETSILDNIFSAVDNPFLL